MSGSDSPNLGCSGDPRMRGFKTRTSLDDLVGWISEHIRPLEDEEVSLLEAGCRVLARDIVADAPVPPFDRAAMDGYALLAEETSGASAYAPAVFRCVGRSRPGVRCEVSVGPSQAVEVATGAPLPTGADVVVPFESTQAVGESVLVYDALPEGRNVSRRGEDIEPGTVVLESGRLIRPQDLGILSALGKRRVAVMRRPRIVVLVTGAELLPPGTPAREFQIPDANSLMIASLTARDGALCEVVGPLADDESTIRHAILQAALRADAIFVSGGSSAGPEDHVPTILAGLGRVIAHGLALRPASPTGVAVIGPNDLPVVMIPGNPVSCLCAYDLVAGRIVRRLAGRPDRLPYRCLTLPLARKLTSIVGRVDYARVRIRAGQVEPLSVSGASILSSVCRADGFVEIPVDSEGYPAGASVVVWCYDDPGPRAVPAQEPRIEAGAAALQSMRKAHQTPLG